MIYRNLFNGKIKFAFFFLSFLLLSFSISCKSVKKATTASSGDGTSIQNAVVVSSINEEYEYVREVCPDCQLLGQSLLFENKKPYDLLEFKRPDGQKLSFYFDISKFFGKY